ncbi:hypothetical protein H7B90_24500 [Cohnella xylanilytica]|uniref:Uncharacterized protein n=1 Tax=Cohnella xylanilytica TaxID=557555 RepID=A0A841U989_9BACL|nr:hypothetical protein [Cohnella xylanilytica]MBB6694561.1 hypothetical protein [Cohnella xylanilytica]
MPGADLLVQHRIAVAVDEVDAALLSEFDFVEGILDGLGQHIDLEHAHLAEGA